MIKQMMAGLLLVGSGLGVAAELKVPEQFDVMMVNGAEFPTTLSRTKTVTLTTGRNVVIIEFDNIYDADFGDSHDRVRSAPFALVFTAAAADQLQLRGPELQSGADAKRYVKAPSVQILAADQHPIAMQQLPVTEVNGLLLADNSPSAKADANGHSGKPEPTMVTDLVPPAGTSQPAASTDSTATNPDALRMLGYWWQQASPEQRAEFLRQITH